MFFVVPMRPRDAAPLVQLGQKASRAEVLEPEVEIPSPRSGDRSPAKRSRVLAGRHAR